MKRLIALGVLVGLAVAADIAAKSFAESKIEERAEARAGVSTSAEAAIRSFPFVPKLLVSGSAGRVGLDITGLAAGRLPVALVEIDVGEVHLDKDKLLQRDVEVTRIRDATVAVELAGPDLAAATRLPVKIQDGEVQVSVAGRSVPVTPEVTASGSLSLEVGGAAPAALALERAGISGCSSTRAEVRGDRLRVECSTDEIPSFLIRAAHRRR